METMKILKPFGKHRLFFWSIAITILTLYNLTPSIGSFDTHYYFIAGEHLWNGELDCLRTPVYPLSLKVFGVCFGEKGGIAGIVIFQSIVYVLSIFSMHRLLVRALKNGILQYALILFYVSCIAPGWCNELTTESLSISGVIILTDLLFQFIDKPSWSKNILLQLLLLFLVFLRPTFILFYVLFALTFIIKLLKAEHKKPYIVALALTLAGILCFGGYAQLYKNKYGIQGTTATFVFNKIYDAHRGGYWDISAVARPDCRRWIDSVDQSYTNNYGVVYDIITRHPESMPLINEGCDGIMQSHLKEHRMYRIELFVSSFDKRFLAAVNTHTPLSAMLFATTLFLSFPLSIFYLLTLVAAIILVIKIFRRNKPSLLFAFITTAIFAHTFGIALTTSDSFERLLLPVYPLFLVLLGIALEKFFEFAKH